MCKRMIPMKYARSGTFYSFNCYTNTPRYLSVKSCLCSIGKKSRVDIYGIKTCTKESRGYL